MKKLSASRIDFFKKTLLIALPIMVQNGITNFVSMLDNIMVGRVGTDAMSGVAIVNQLLFVFNLCVFGGLSGIGIFTAQYYGKGDDDGVRHTFRLQLLLAVLLTILGFLIFVVKGDTLIGLFLTGTGGTVDAGLTRSHANRYLEVMLLQLLPFAITQAYASTLRGTGETVLPMQASLVAVVVNLIGNYVLIYGKFGAPALGAVGAAVATTASRFVELLYLTVRTHLQSKKYRFIHGAYRNFFDIPPSLIVDAVKKGTPLLMNEALWSGGMTTLSQTYSIRSLEVVAAVNISSTISNVFNIAFIAMGSAIAIIIGQELGSGNTTGVKKDAQSLAWFSVVLCVISGALLFLVSGLFPQIYNTSPEIRHIATGLIRISAVFMPMYAFENACYFTIRSGGKTLITFVFDSLFLWIASIPLANILVRFTGMPILPLYACVQAIELIKCLIGHILVKRGIWIHDLTNQS
ncbi:MAG: MATE family efflux transporter [Eubacteriales bacterium]|nr:MATE family efflux transporter [Eubacteriales bacterium]